jgi:hypothetical protein
MTINSRLSDAQHRGFLRTTDMAHWFGVNRSTMCRWLEGVTPNLSSQALLEQDLQLLEQALENTDYFPVPLGVSQYQRKEYIKAAKNAVSPSIPRSGSSE